MKKEQEFNVMLYFEVFLEGDNRRLVDINKHEILSHDNMLGPF